jgi:hypothetical protein
MKMQMEKERLNMQNELMSLTLTNTNLKDDFRDRER